MSDAKMSNAVEEDLYPHPLDDDVEFTAITWREQCLRNISQAIRNKPNWTEKVLDRALFAKWLREAEIQAWATDGDKVLIWDKNTVELVYKELVDHYKPYVEDLRQKGVNIEPDLDGVWRSDNFLDDELRRELIDAVATLEDIPDEEKDWHPGTDKQVLDLVHPSMWPLIYGKSISLENGKPFSMDEEYEDGDGFSDAFCWLPSEFEISADGQKTKIASYINNLSTPEQKKLFYPILEKIFTKFVPLFNHVLSDLRENKQYLCRAAPPSYYTEGSEKEWLLAENHKKLWDELLDQFIKGEDITVDFEEAIETFDGDDADEQRENMEYGDWDRSDGNDGDDEKNTRYQAHPYQVREMGHITGDFWAPPDIEKSNAGLEGKTVKVIVKLANILLTPESPTYGGGSWHVEAMKNERIISTGIYYYEQENVTESSLAFRRTLEDMEDLSYSLPQDSNWTTIHNLSREGNSVQEMGAITTSELRAIAFPNILQHQVQPFELVDKTKPGYRKILVFFLCDTSELHTVPTTRTVAPQQPEARQYLEEALREGPLGKLPEEVFRLIVEALPPLITRQEAEKIREELMSERSSYVEESEKVQGRGYNLCEH